VSTAGTLSRAFQFGGELVHNGRIFYRGAP
jgi:hypothetical protein